MRPFCLLFLVIAATVFIGCDAAETATPAEQHRHAVALDDITRHRAESAATAAAMHAEAMRYPAPTGVRPALSKTVPAARNAGSVITVPGDFETIQDAVDAAAPGDVVAVRGTFADLGVIFISNGGITLDGSKAHLKGRADMISRIMVQADDVQVTGFKLDSMRIWVFGGNRAVITDNTIAHTGSALAAFGGSEGAVFNNNHAHNSVHGLFLTNTHNNRVENNTFNSNANVGIILTDTGFGEMPTHNNTLLNNTVNGNWRGIRVFGSNGNAITECTVNGSDLSGIVLFESTGNRITDCKANGNSFDGFLLLDSSTNELRESQANGNAEVGIDLIGSDNNTVADSQARGNKTCDVEDDGTGNSFVNNKIGSMNCK